MRLSINTQQFALGSLLVGSFVAVSASAQTTPGPRPAIVLEQPRTPPPKTLTDSAAKNNSPGLLRYSSELSNHVDMNAANDVQRVQDRASVLSEIPKSMVLYVGQMTLIKASSVARVAIGNGKVVNARMLDGDNLLITAMDAGDSTLHVWTKSGNLKKVKVRVNLADNERAIDELRDMTAGIPGVSIRRVGERVVMDGTNLDPGAVARLDTLAKLYPQVVNLATADRIRVDRMVEIQVKFMEFNKTALDNLGVQWQNVADGFSFGLFSDILSNGRYRVLPSGSGFSGTSPGYPGSDLQRTTDAYFGLATTITSRLNLLVQRGNAYLLASPNLSTRSGGEAKFLAGGEIPLPAISALGGGSVDFKAYGVLLNIKPIADGEGNIAGNILTEVSSIDRSVAVQGIPGLLIRRTDTEFNVRDGETIVLSGLISRESSRSSDGLPGLRRLPILGQAFRSDNDNDKETEVVVFITPRVVDASHSKPRIERANQKEEELKRAYGDLTEERTPPRATVKPVSSYQNGGRLHPDYGP